MPVFNDVTGADSTKYENIGMTTGGTTTTNGQPVVNANLTGTGRNQGGTPRSTLMSDLKLAGECVGGNANGGGAGNANAPTGGTCYLTAKMGNKANVAIKGTQVQLSRTADGVWSCKIKEPTPKGGWKDKFIPSGCSKETAGGTAQGWQCLALKININPRFAFCGYGLSLS